MKKRTSFGEWFFSEPVSFRIEVATYILAIIILITVFIRTLGEILH